MSRCKPLTMHNLLAVENRGTGVADLYRKCTQGLSRLPWQTATVALACSASALWMAHMVGHGAAVQSLKLETYPWLECIVQAPFAIWQRRPPPSICLEAIAVSSILAAAATHSERGSVQQLVMVSLILPSLMYPHAHLGL